MIEIDCLRLHLPGGWEKRATRIARLVGHELARLPQGPAESRESLRVPGLRLPASLSDRAAAARIAAAIHGKLTEGR